MISIPVALGARSYDVLIEDGALDNAADHLGPWLHGPAVVVTDEHVAARQLPRLAAALDIRPVILPAGEGTKSWAGLESLLDQLLALGLERGDHVIALGGGVIGDLVGFAASILKRGCNFIQIPTSLLAQVDSSVGGKTAINTVAGKNLVGSFHQPSFVLIDPTVLDTLPPRELRAGYAEVVKYGLIDDFPFFEWCEANAAALLAGDSTARAEAIGRSIAAKAAIVAADERETLDRRALLNLGHTFGHALETAGHYTALLHGEGVAIGMLLAARLSERLGMSAPAASARLQRLLKAVGLPVAVPPGMDPPQLLALMRLDKKNTAGTLRLILWRGIGQAEIVAGVAEPDVLAVLTEATSAP